MPILKKKVKVDYNSEDAITVERQTQKCIEPNCNNRVSRQESETTGGYCYQCYKDTMSDFGF